MPVTRFHIACVSLLVAAIAPLSHADEGMWTFDHFPSDKVKSRYGVVIDSAWLEKVRLATVRLSNCTGSFVSANGLVLTNHHCAAACLDELSTPEHSLLAEGFVARTHDDERKCPRQIADVLIESENVTAQINAAIKGLNALTANDARRKASTSLEEQCEAASRRNGMPLKCEAVTLYGGGQYFLYKYKRYTDLRLVFAPESAIAAFGGDPDNFQFPRWCLDMSVLRVYENDRPINPQAFLRVNFNGAQPDELVFVPGHPGSTQRSMTVDQLIDRRNALPATLLRSSELRGRYLQFAKLGTEQNRIVQERLQTLENGIKVRRKQLDALLDERMMAAKRKEEAIFRSLVAKRRKLAIQTGSAWDDIEHADRIGAALELPYSQLEGALGFQSQLFGYARTLARGAVERAKPNTERLKEFADARLLRIEQQLQAATPVYADLETLTLSFSLERMRELLGPDHEIVRMLLSKDSPDSLAARLVGGSKLSDPNVRMALWQGGAAAIEASNDPMIQLARSIDDDARVIRKQVEDQVEAPVRAATERIAAARFAIYGTNLYPDATFTLRLNYGTVRGWKEGIESVAPLTRLSRLFERATGTDPFRLPERWAAAKDQLDPETPFNMATTNDIIGGNSGSALVNAKGELVGLIFDGNVHAIGGALWYDSEKNRAVAVHPAIIQVALEQVYRADKLAKELRGEAVE